MHLELSAVEPSTVSWGSKAERVYLTATGYLSLPLVQLRGTLDPHELSGEGSMVLRLKGDLQHYLALVLRRADGVLARNDPFRQR